MSEDTISRQAAIEAIENTDWYHLMDGVMVRGANSKEGEPLYKAEDVYKVLNDMPSAQPETHEERTETHACDYISRQDAIDAVESMLRRKFGIGGDLAEITLAELPSAQPEIIYCKDCKYWNDEFAKDKSTCWLPCMSMTTHRKWHCGSAERGTDDGE